MAPRKVASSAGSSNQTSASTQRTSASSRGTDRTSSTQATSISSKTRPLPSVEESTKPPTRRYNTRLRTGAIKRKDPEPSEGAQGLSTKKAKSGKSKDTSNPPAIGSPWDVTVRRKLRVEDLDLDTAYAEVPSAVSVPERPPRQRRWKHQGDTPLTDVKKLPKNWTMREPDLDDEYALITHYSILAVPASN